MRVWFSVWFLYQSVISRWSRHKESRSTVWVCLSCKSPTLKNKQKKKDVRASCMENNIFIKRLLYDMSSPYRPCLLVIYPTWTTKFAATTTTNHSGPMLAVEVNSSVLFFFAVKIYVTSGCSSHKREMYFADRVSNSALNQKSMYADDTLLFLIIRKFDGKSPRPKKKRNKKDMTLYIISQVHFIYHCVPS